MSRFISPVLAGLLAVLLVGAPAQAGLRSPDPEVVEHTAVPSTASAAKVTPGTIDSDVYAYAVSASSSAYFVVAGHLRLQLKPGSTVRYDGSLVDYVGQKSYKANADTTDASAPVLKLEGKNGKFTFKLDQFFGGSFYTGTATSKPPKVKVPTSQVHFLASAHSVKTATYSFGLTERSGSINDPLSYAGTLTIAYDTNGRVSGGQVTVTNGKGKNVTHGLKSSGFYGAGFFYTVAQVDQTFFGLTATVTGTSISGYGFGADGAKTTQWVLTGTA